MDVNKAEMGNRGSTGSMGNGDMESSVDLGEYGDFVTPKSNFDTKKSTKQSSSTPLVLDNISEDETSESDDAEASPDKNVTRRKQKVREPSTVEEEGSSKPAPAKKQKTINNVSNLNDDGEPSSSVFLGKFNFRAMDERKKKFFDDATALNQTIKLSIPKSHDQRMKGFGFIELISEEASELRDTLERMLECPKCYERLHPPVIECVNGHGFCNKCDLKGLDQCTICNGQFVKGQYYLLNDIIKAFQFRCKFAIHGCGFRSTPTDLTQHEKFCNYRVVVCPLSKDGKPCELIVPIPSYPEHVEAHHETYVNSPFTLNSDYECVLPKKDQLEQGNCFYRFLKDVINKLNFLEMTHYDDKFKTYTISVHLIGKESQASNFIYTIDVTGDEILKQFKCSRDCLPNIMTASEAEKYFLFTLPDRDDKFSIHKDLKYNLRIEKKEDFGKSLIHNGTSEDSFADIPVIDL